MNEKNEKNLRVIKGKETPKQASTSCRHTNPIMKKALEFHKEIKGKFTVKDLFNNK